ncbi:MAG TPA: adenine phosphoribosyltransferase [Rhodospirillaceae bacterium]|nr:adenine phosphoribosyltransferase [Rhodospirillaceae bacterium]HAA91125.1 adenine phosphoribosyltransferase [Rhodospirillaceae bacterium]HAT34882.1 adenine phosphoribosyltransferase [Rhodospirillaceae bacterium]
MNLKDHIRGIPDFPKPGILFYDISTLLAHPPAWQACITQLAEIVAPQKPDLLVGIESRGFLTAAPLALELGVGFSMIRKKGKLPGETIAHDYDLEYGTDTIEIQADAIEKGQKVVILDDLLATGGTAAATVQLLTQVGANVLSAAFIIELTFLGGREKLDIPAHSLIAYDD